MAALRQHREWADRRIAQLIRRVGDAELPLREEASRLLVEVQALRVSPVHSVNLALQHSALDYDSSTAAIAGAAMKPSVHFLLPCPAQVEKEGMKAKLLTLERSVARIRDSSSAYERRAAEAAAELKAASLREQVGGSGEGI